jgi:hypothetical protein
MSTLDAFGRDFDPPALDPGEGGENYISTVIVGGSTRCFRPAPVVSARPAPVAERPGPEGNFLEGFACGFALALPLWFALTAVVLWLAGR